MTTVKSRPVGYSEWLNKCKGGLLAEAGLNFTQIAVAYTIAAYATMEDGNDVRPSRETVAKGVGCSPRTVTAATVPLVEKGFLALVKAHSPHRPALYRLTLPVDLAPLPDEDVDVDDERATDLSADEAARVEAFEQAPDPYADEPAARHLSAVPPAAGEDAWAMAERDLAQKGKGSPAPAPVEPEADPYADVPDFEDDEPNTGDVPSFEDQDDQDDDEEREPEPPRLGRFAARDARARAEQEARAAEARQPERRRRGRYS